jgi:hypothetical protein
VQFPNTLLAEAFVSVNAKDGVVVGVPMLTVNSGAALPDETPVTVPVANAGPKMPQRVPTVQVVLYGIRALAYSYASSLEIVPAGMLLSTGA